MENIGTASYAEDNTPYITLNSIEEVIQKLENAAKTLFQWLSDNQMKANPDKCHFLCSSNRDVNLTTENQIVKNSKFNHGLESLSYIGAKLWDSIPSHMKEIDSVNEFKHVIKTWKHDLCSGRLCKVYLQNIGCL